MIKITENIPIIKMMKSHLSVTKYSKYYTLLVLPSTSERSEVLKFLRSLTSQYFSHREEAISLTIHYFNAENPTNVEKDIKSHQYQMF
jgi:hypothetical protein